MLLLEIFRYLKRRADKRPVHLRNFVDQSHHHSSRGWDPEVTIVIPTRDKYDLLKACIDSVISKTTYSQYQIMVVDNASSCQKTLNYIDSLAANGVRVLRYPKAFNYSKICNYAVAEAASPFFCFLNNDTEVLEPNWLSLLVDHALQPDVGVVGAKLLYSDGSIQHMGIAMGFTGVATHPFRGEIARGVGVGPLGKLCFKAMGATFACALVGRGVLEGLGGLSPKYRVGFNDVDFCLRAREIGLSTVICSGSTLYHHESQTRKSTKSIVGATRATYETALVLSRHKLSKLRDVYFSRLD